MSPSRTAALLASLALRASVVEAGVRLDLVRDEGAERCDDGASVQREVTRRLGADPFAGAPDRFIDVTLSRVGLSWSARVRIRDGAGASVGERELRSEAPTCGALSEALTLSLALLIDPTAQLRDDTPLTPPPPPPAPPLPQCDVVPTPPPRPPPPRRVARRSVVVSLRGVGSVGVEPAFAPGVALRAELELSRRWRVRLEGRWLSETSVPGANGWRVGLTAAYVGACASPVGGDTLALDLCAAAGVGAMRISVDDVRAMNTGDHPWASVGAAPRLRWRPRPWLELDADVSVDAALVRRAFGVAGEAAPRFDPDVVSVTAGLGAGVVLP